MRGGENGGVAALLGLLVAVTYGAADFFGGVSAKRTPTTLVVVASQVLGLPVLAVVLVLTSGTPTARVLGLGAAAGAAGGVALIALYRGLAIARMSVVAPITAVGAAVVPLAVGLARGERPSPVALAGVVAALAAVVLISRTPGPADEVDGPSGIVLAVVAGIGFGAVFVLLADTGPDAGFWPLLTGRLTSIVLLSTGAILGRRSLRPARLADLSTVAVAGVFDISANALYLLAARSGLLSLVAVLASLYPASTVVLARFVLHERLHRAQVVGLSLAAAGVVLIAAG